MRIIRIANEPTLPDDALVDVRLPDRSFSGYVRPAMGTPKGMVVIQDKQTGKKVVVPISNCSINDAFQKQRDNWHNSRVYNEMEEVHETSEKMGRLFQDANP